MTDTRTDTRNSAREILRSRVGRDDADFHDGQFEAISALVDRHERALVVQRTGWGKSAVYFVATLLLRRTGRGPTILVSPLLALMRDQVTASATARLRAVTLNSSNVDDWSPLETPLAPDEVYVLPPSPERRASPPHATAARPHASAPPRTARPPPAPPRSAGGPLTWRTESSSWRSRRRTRGKDARSTCRRCCSTS